MRPGEHRRAVWYARRMAVRPMRDDEIVAVKAMMAALWPDFDGEAWASPG
jgi:hypothetical protein